MAKSSAERQAEYRARRATSGEKGDGERRLSTYISTRSDLALERLACRFGVTKKEMLENLILQADDEVKKLLDPDTLEWEFYFDKKPPVTE